MFMRDEPDYDEDLPATWWDQNGAIVTLVIYSAVTFLLPWLLGAKNQGVYVLAFILFVLGVILVMWDRRRLNKQRAIVKAMKRAYMSGMASRRGARRHQQESDDTAAP